MSRSRVYLAVSAFVAALTVVPAASAAAVTVDDPAQYVNPLVGTKPGGPDFGHGGGAEIGRAHV